MHIQSYHDDKTACDAAAAIVGATHRYPITSYMFTSIDSDADLDGVPACIFEINQFGSYTLEFIEGSRLDVQPHNIRFI